MKKLNQHWLDARSTLMPLHRPRGHVQVERLEMKKLGRALNGDANAPDVRVAKRDAHRARQKSTARVKSETSKCIPAFFPGWLQYSLCFAPTSLAIFAHCSSGPSCSTRSIAGRIAEQSALSEGEFSQSTPAKAGSNLCKH